jgi:hypothetical protein
MKGEKSSIWGKAPNLLKGKPGEDMNANEILGKDVTMGGVANAAKSESSKAPAHDAAETTEKDVANKESNADPKSKSAPKKGDSTDDEKAKLSKFAQNVGSPRKGF